MRRKTSYGLIIFFSIAVSSAILISSVCSHAAGKKRQDNPVDNCTESAATWWTPQEEWVWERVCMGEIAEFEPIAHFDALRRVVLDTARGTKEKWPMSMVLSPKCVDTILLREPYCNILAQSPENWSTWVWDRLCGGKIADLEAISDFDALSDITLNTAHGAKGKWPMSPVLSPEFLDTILRREPYRTALAHKGLRIVGAKFFKPLDLPDLDVSHRIWLDKCEFFEDVTLDRLKSSSVLSLDGSKFRGELSMNALKIEQSLFMRYGAEFASIVDLQGAKIEGSLEMQNSAFKSDLNMDLLKVGLYLLMCNGATFQKVSLPGANIVGDVIMGICDKEDDSPENGPKKGSTFNGELKMDSIKVGQDLLMGDGANFAKVNLRGANIVGDVKMGICDQEDNSPENGPKNGSTFNDEVDITSAQIGHNLAISDSTFHNSLNLTGTRVVGEFKLNSRTRWNEESYLGLRNTEVDSLADHRKAWPENPDIVGFTYNHLVPAQGRDNCNLVYKSRMTIHKFYQQHAWLPWGLIHEDDNSSLEDDNSSLACRDLEWLRTKWLPGGDGFSPQPYEQLAEVLKRTGFKDKANYILFEKKQQERYHAKPESFVWLAGWVGLLCVSAGLSWWYLKVGRSWFRPGSRESRLWLAGLLLAAGVSLWFLEAWGSWFELTAQRHLIGYGYDLFRCLWAIGVFLWFGWAFAWRDPQGKQNGRLWCLIYSVDMLLPIIQLDKRNYDIPLDLGRGAKYYFYMHKIVGYILASFIIAGISGLTKQ